MSNSEITTAPATTDYFKLAQDQFQAQLTTLSKSGQEPCSHAVIEEQILAAGTEIMRLLFQGYLDLKSNEEMIDNTYKASEFGTFRRVRSSCQRQLITRFGKVRLERTGYFFSEGQSIFPLDAKLNLSDDSYSDGLHRLAAKFSADLSFDKTLDFIKDTCGSTMPKRQIEQSICKTSRQFDCFYSEHQAANDSGIEHHLVLTADAKGIVMREESLRPQTRKNAEKKSQKQTSKKHRLGKGEKNNRKRMAEVVSVYDIKPHIRTAESVLNGSRTKDAPKPSEKKVWASVNQPAASVIDQMVEHAKKRDSNLCRPWFVLVDGQTSQLKQIQKSLKASGISKATIIVDIIHVIEYLWKASYCFYKSGSVQAQAWVKQRLSMLLQGQVSQVAKGMRQSATKALLNSRQRKAVDPCADYLLKLKPYMKYDQYLAQGAPIATGVIEGACRYLIKDRMDITGARWHLEGAESILRNRAIITNGDFEKYWEYYCSERQKEIYPYFKQTTSDLRVA